MMKVNREKANRVYKEVKQSGTVKSERTKITRTLEIEVIVLDGWEYTFYFLKGALVKIEEYNHRELIEVTAEQKVEKNRYEYASKCIL